MARVRQLENTTSFSTLTITALTRASIEMTHATTFDSVIHVGPIIRPLHSRGMLKYPNGTGDGVYLINHPQERVNDSCHDFGSRQEFFTFGPASP